MICSIRSGILRLDSGSAIAGIDIQVKAYRLGM